MQASIKIAVAGATGRVGRHVVDVLDSQGHEVVPMSRSHGVDVITGEGLAAALADVECVIDAATGPSAEQAAATAFFTTAARNLQQAGQEAGVRRVVVVSIIGTDRFSAGYGAVKIAHEQAMRSGPIPVRVLRAAQFHEFVAQLVTWGTQGDVSYLPRMRTQLVAARPSPRCSPTWPPNQDPTVRPCPRSPGPGRRAWSRWRGCSSPGTVAH
ncbi:MAG: SDR family oxidoreductase [Acidimicrobiales bacterium]